MTNDSTWLARTNQGHDNNGKFATKDYGAKSLRSMRLSDEAWQLLADRGAAEGKTRTDVIEELARGANEQEIVLKALRAFIALQVSEFGNNPAQKNKEFNINTRNWAAFNKFAELVRNSPWELGLDEDTALIDETSD